MVNVFFETKTHAELVASFSSEDVYDACRPALEAKAKKDRMFVTESINEYELEDVVDATL